MVIAAQHVNAPQQVVLRLVEKCSVQAGRWILATLVLADAGHNAVIVVPCEHSHSLVDTRATRPMQHRRANGVAQFSGGRRGKGGCGLLWSVVSVSCRHTQQQHSTRPLLHHDCCEKVHGSAAHTVRVPAAGTPTIETQGAAPQSVGSPGYQLRARATVLERLGATGTASQVDVGPPHHG